MNKDQPYVTPLYEGTFSVGLDKKFNPVHREDPPAKGALKLSINPFLIKTGDRNILFDAGLGDLGEGTSTETIKKNLSEHDVFAEDITDIFISHLHFDHIGGLVGRTNGYPELTFPDAKIWTSKEGWATFLDQHNDADGKRGELVHFLEARAAFHYLDKEDEPYPDLHVKEIGGHTIHSLLLLWHHPDVTFMMAGDVIGRKSAVKRKYTAKFDSDPKKSMEVREQLKQQAFKKKYIVMAYHDPFTPLFRITGSDKKGSYQTEPWPESNL